MPNVRVFHDGTKVVAIEHRVDETYTAENRHGNHQDYSALVVDAADLSDAEGPIPFEALIPGGSGVGVDTVKRDAVRQAQKDRTVGAGGRLDTLRQKLADDAITDAELRELLRLSRGLV